MADQDRLTIWETLFAKALRAIDSAREPRTTFKELEVLDYRPTYDHCVQVVKRVLKRSR
jgi:hypothetical protein